MPQIRPDVSSFLICIEVAPSYFGQLASLDDKLFRNPITTCRSRFRSLSRRETMQVGDLVLVLRQGADDTGKVVSLIGEGW